MNYSNKIFDDRKTVKAIAEENKVDVGIALTIYCKEKNIDMKSEDVLEFQKMLTDIQTHPTKTLADFWG